MTDRIKSNKLRDRIKVRVMMENYNYETFEKGKYDFTSPLHMRSLVHHKDSFQ